MHEIVGAIFPEDEWEMSVTLENERVWYSVKSESAGERFREKHFSPQIPLLTLPI